MDGVEGIARVAWGEEIAVEESVWWSTVGLVSILWLHEIGARERDTVSA
jgi:hypothetical protein